MMTIEIVQEQPTAKLSMYRAICGAHQAVGDTPGEALDILERRLASLASGAYAGTTVIVQRFRPDDFFTADQQARLQELMDRFHTACDAGQALTEDEKYELEKLVDTEWQAAIKRAAAILEETQSSQP